MGGFRRDYFSPILAENPLGSLDYEALQRQSGLIFDEGSRRQIWHAVSLYKHLSQSELVIPAKTVRTKLHAITKACDILKEVLAVYDRNILAEVFRGDDPEFVANYNSKPELQAAAFHSIPKDEFCVEEVAKFLALWRDNASQAITIHCKTGKPTDHPRLGFLIELRKAYKLSGGVGLGCYKHRDGGTNDDKFGGNFLALALAVLDQSGVQISSSSLGEYILEKSAQGDIV